MADGKQEAILGLGERLRSARKARALSLEQAAQTLHLEEPALRALEEERFDVLGAPVFVRGHLKAYARLLGLSEEAILQAYRAADPSSVSERVLTRPREKPLNHRPGPLSIALWFAVGLVVLIVILVLQSTGPDVSGEVPAVGAGSAEAPASGTPAIAVPLPSAAPQDSAIASPAGESAQSPPQASALSPGGGELVQAEVVMEQPGSSEARTPEAPGAVTVPASIDLPATAAAPAATAPAAAAGLP